MSLTAHFSSIIARHASACIITACLFFTGIPASGQGPSTPSNAENILLSSLVSERASKMSADSFVEVRSASAANQGSAMTAGAAGGVIYHVLNVEFKTADARRAIFTDQKRSLLDGATILTVFDRFADVFVQKDAPWKALAANPNVLKVEYGTEVLAPPPPDVTPAPLITTAIPESIIRGGYQGLSGKNVIIAVLDTGIDFRHPDFIQYDASGRPTSRIAYLWDTSTEFQKGVAARRPSNTRTALRSVRYTLKLI